MEIPVERESCMNVTNRRSFLGRAVVTSAAAVAAALPPAGAQDKTAKKTDSPHMEFLYDINLDAFDVQDVGLTPSGRRRIVIVKSGRFEGPRLKGEVLPGGGDWTLERTDGSRRLDVRMTLKTDDGHLIYTSYSGILQVSADVMRRITEGANVDVSEYYFRATPLFETASGKYGWLNGIVALGLGWRTSAQAGYKVYQVL
jgi:hypothetical protein